MLMKTILLFFLIFGMYTLIYNLSIYLLVTLNGGRVEKFYLGYDIWFRLFKFKYKKTEFGIGWLPIGGYVKITGMNVSENDLVLPYYFDKLSFTKQFYITIVGPISSLIILLLLLIFYNTSIPNGIFEILIFSTLVSFGYYLIFRIVFPIKKSLKTPIYIFLIIFQSFILYIYSILINKVFPLYQYLNDIFIERNRVHLFFKDYNSISIELILYSLGIIFFFINLFPIGSSVGFNVVTILYKSITGDKVSNRLFNSFSLVSYIFVLLLYSYLAYMLLF